MGKIGIQCIFPPILRVQMAFYAIFQFFYVSFRQQARNLVKMKKNIFCLLYFGRKIHFLKLSRRCRPPRVGIRFYNRRHRVPTPESRNPIKDFLQILLSSFFSSSLLLLHITSHSDRSRRHPSPPCHSRVPKLHCK